MPSAALTAGPSQSGALSHRQRINGLVFLSGFSECLPNHRHNRTQMLAGGKFGHYSSIGLVRSNLPSNDI